MNWLPRAVPSRERAAALIIVLAFVVLLTGLAVAYLSRATSDRQVAHGSFNQSNVDLLAQSAMDTIIGELRQEIVDGSASPAPTVSVNGVDVTIYTPTSAANMVPVRNVNLSGVFNLIRRSALRSTHPPPFRDQFHDRCVRQWPLCYQHKMERSLLDSEGRREHQRSFADAHV